MHVADRFHGEASFHMSNIGCMFRLFLLLALMFGGMILVGRFFGQIGGFVYIVGIAMLIIQYDKRRQKKDADEQAKLFAGVTCTINAAYPYTDATGYIEPETGCKLIAIDISWKGPSDEVDFTLMYITDAEYMGVEDTRFYQSNLPNIAFLDPATGRPVERLPYRLPSEFRFMLVYLVSQNMNAFKLSINGWNLTPEPVLIAESAPPNAPQPTAEDFERYEKVHD